MNGLGTLSAVLGRTEGGVCGEDERSMSIDGMCLRSITDTTTWKVINAVVGDRSTAQSSARWMQEDQNRMAGLWCTGGVGDLNGETGQRHGGGRGGRRIRQPVVRNVDGRERGYERTGK